ncbi:MAG: hypothetical protein U0640_04485 [Phycisphaerales bacterium]
MKSIACLMSFSFAVALGSVAVAQQCTTGLIPMGYMGVSDENGSTNTSPSARTNAMALWDPDGDGPQPEMLVVGGAFRSIDGVPASSIAAWNGSTWQAIGNGFPNRATPGALDINLDSEVTALTVHNGTLYAAGRLAFTTPAGGVPLRVARWTGSTWEQIGQDNSNGGTARINAIQFAYNRLYVGGSFSYSSNGTWWSLGYYSNPGPNSTLTPVTSISIGSQNVVRSMTMHNGELFVAGTLQGGFSFDQRVVRVLENGSVMSTQLDCQGSCSGGAQQLVSTGGQLYVAGSYLLQNGTFRSVARYLGNGLGWEIVGSNPLGINTSSTVSIAVDGNGSLYRSMGFIAERWDGSTWIQLGSQNGGTSIGSSANVTGRLLGSYQGKPIMGGRYASVQDGDQTVNNVRFLESLAYVNSDGYWMPISQGVDNAISDMALFGEDIIAVGRIGSAGGQRCNNIAVFGADNRWRPWANNNGFERQTRSVAIYQGQPIVSGGYNAAGTTVNPFVRRWDGAQWVDMPVPPNGTVETFTVAGDELWAEVQTSRGGGEIPRFFRWNGDSWDQNPGLSVANLQECLGQVWGTRTGTIYTAKVIRWNGNSWEDVGPLTSNGKSLIGEYQGSVLAIGYYVQTPNLLRSAMYRLVSGEWQYVGDYSTPRSVYNLTMGYRTRRVTESGNLLIPSGTASDLNGFTFPAGTIWDGTAWSNTGGLPMNIPSQPITWINSSPGGIPIARGSDVFIAGAFIGRHELLAGSANPFRRAMSYFARLEPGWNSQFSPHQDYEIDPGETLVINSGATRFTSGVWRLNGVPIVSGPRPSGAQVSGTTTQVLTITDMTQAEQGLYDFTSNLPGCVSVSMFNSLASAGSAMRTVSITVRNTCDSIDFNNDASAPDPQDIEAFLSVFSEGACIPETATCNDIDFNNDGSIFDPRDIESFLSVYSEGACL